MSLYPVTSFPNSKHVFLSINTLTKHFEFYNSRLFFYSRLWISDFNFCAEENETCVRFLNFFHLHRQRFVETHRDLIHVRLNRNFSSAHRSSSFLNRWNETIRFVLLVSKNSISIVFAVPQINPMKSEFLFLAMINSFRFACVLSKIKRIYNICVLVEFFFQELNCRWRNEVETKQNEIKNETVIN